MNHLEVILGILQQIINTLNESGLKVYDAENPDYYISDIIYDPEADQLIAHFKEEK